MPQRAIRVTAIAASAQLGGTERVLLDFAARAFEHDLALRVLTPREGPLVGILEGIGVPAQVVPASRILLAGSQRPGALWSLPGALAGLIEWAGHLARHPFLADADVLYTVAFKAHLAAARLHYHPVVWHLHEYPPALTGPLWRALGRRLPDAAIANSRATAAAWGARPARAPRGGEPGGETQRSAPGLPAPAHSGARLEAWTLGRTRLEVIPNGVDLDRFRPRPKSFWIHQRLGIPRDRRLVGMPAVLARWKGQLELLEAFSRIAARHPDTHLVLVGGSIYDTVAELGYEHKLRMAVEAATQATAQLGLQDGPRVHLLPFQPKIELVYPEFDLAVHYSLRPEPFGRVILEALACGVPVLAAAEGGPLEILGDETAGAPRTGQRHRLRQPGDRHPVLRRRQPGAQLVRRTACGWLVPPRQAAQLAAALSQALSLSAAELAGIGQAARRRAEDRFSARQFARQVAGVLRRAVLQG